MRSGEMSRRLCLGWSVGLACGWVLPAQARKLPARPAAPAEPAAPAAPTWLTPTLAVEAVYITALFLSGNAEKSPEVQPKADAAMARLMLQWMDRRRQLAALWPKDREWQMALDAVQLHIEEAADLSRKRQWREAHLRLEQVRDILAQARRARDLDFIPDRYTAFHEPMEKLAAAGASAEPLDRATLQGVFTQARVLWRAVESAEYDPERYAVSPVRQEQQAKAIPDVTAALSLINIALQGGTDEELRERLKAVKPPFVRAYTSFGWATNEYPKLP